MRLATFRGGVHPYDGKSLTKDCPVKVLLPGNELVFPVSQHIGAPAVPAVKKKDTVLMGQTIATAGGFVSADIVSSVSGTVKAIEPRLTVSGVMVNSIVIENDGNYTPFQEELNRKPGQMSREDVIGAVKAAGIVGLGGAGFPTHVKLSPKDPDAIDYVIVNGAECEPYLTSDYRMLLEEPEKIVGGLNAVLRLFENAKGVIAIENNKPEAIERMKQAVDGQERITVLPLKTKYPQGAERNLIYAVTGRKINSKHLPADAGCIVDNVDTIIAIYNAVVRGIPLMRRIFTATGSGIVSPANYEVKIGSSFSEVASAAGGLKESAVKIIAGGPMMGMALSTLDVPIVKTSSALLCLEEDDAADYKETACINCGRCLSVCPSHLAPKMMMDAAERFDKEYFISLNGMECYECGSCTYICPARRPLTQGFKQMRQAVMADRRKAK